MWRGPRPRTPPAGAPPVARLHLDQTPTMAADASLSSWSVGYDQIKPKYVARDSHRHARLDAVADAVIGYTDPTVRRALP